MLVLKESFALTAVGWWVKVKQKARCELPIFAQLTAVAVRSAGVSPADLPSVPLFVEAAPRRMSLLTHSLSRLLFVPRVAGYSNNR